MLLVYLPPECPLKLQFPVSKYLVIPFLLCWWKSWSIMPISHTFQSPRNYYSVICTGDHALLLRQPVSAKSIRFCRKAIARWSDFLMWLRFHIGKGGNEKEKKEGQWWGEMLEKMMHCFSRQPRGMSQGGTWLALFSSLVSCDYIQRVHVRMSQSWKSPRGSTYISNSDRASKWRLGDPYPHSWEKHKSPGCLCVLSYSGIQKYIIVTVALKS